MYRPLKSNTFAFVIATVFLFSFVSAETYYIRPTSSSSCSNDSESQGLPCLTLSEYAINQSNYTAASNITLILLPGNHTLDRELVFSNATIVAIDGEMLSNTSDTTVACIRSTSAKFLFNQVSDVSMSGIVFSGCVNNSVMSAKQFTLINSTFNAQYQEGIGLYLLYVNTVNIVRSTFSNHMGGYDRHVDPVFRAGVVYVNSTSNLFILNSTFVNNMVKSIDVYSVPSGAALLATYSRNVIISDSTFFNNTVNSTSPFLSTGGILFVQYHIVDTLKDENIVNHSIIRTDITRSRFSNNRVISTSGAYGGVLSFEVSERLPSTLNINDSNFTNNAVLSNSSARGGAVHFAGETIFVGSSTFINNTVQGVVAGRGGAIHASISNQREKETFPVVFYGSEFTGNNVYFLSDESQDLVVGAGGAIAVIGTSSVMIHNTKFTYNSVISTRGGQGGAVSIEYSVTAVNVSGCEFLHNALIGNGFLLYGGGIYISYVKKFFVNSSTFNNGSVFNTGYSGMGGAIFSNFINGEIVNSTFSNNTVWCENNAIGGAVVSPYLQASCSLNNCLFVGNNVSSNNISSGGALSLLNVVSLTVDSCTFLSNSLLSPYYGNGGTLFVYMSLTGIGSTLLKNTNFTNNSVVIVPGVWFNRTKRIVINQKILDFHAVPVNESQNVKISGYGGATIIVGGATYIEQCQFINNSLSGLTDAEGGALGLIKTTATMLGNNVFTYNFASGYGGAISSEASTLINNGVLDVQHNTGQFGTLFVFNSYVHLNGSTIVSNNNELSSFVESNMTASVGQVTGLSAKYGGGIVLYQSDFNMSGTVNITNNAARRGGAIFLHSGNLYFNGRVTIGHNQAQFGGGIFIRSSFLVFNDGTDVTISENTAEIDGGGVYAISSNTILYGSEKSLSSVQYFANRAVNGGGGGLLLIGSSSLYIIKPYSTTASLNFEFVGNSAIYGGAIYVVDETYTSTCIADPTEEITAHSGECFLQAFPGYSPTSINFNYIKLNSVNFTGNVASKAGAVLYGGLLDRCIVNSFTEILNKFSHFDSTLSLQRPAYYLSNITNLKLSDFQSTAIVSSKAVRICFCVNGTADCEYQPPVRSVRRAQGFHVSLAAIDQMNNVIPATILATLSSTSGGLFPGQSQQNVADSCTDLKYTISSEHQTLRLFLYASGPCNSSGISQRHQDIEFLPCGDCPIGFMPDEQCVCSICTNELVSFITNCSLASTTLRTRSNYWINYTDEDGYTGHQCPFDYCKSSPVNVNLTVLMGSDDQCAFNRSGWLCGKCKSGFSLTLGGSHCKPNCSHYSLFLIIPFALFGIALIALLLFCNLTVAVGTINGLVFYANIFQANRALFIPAVSVNDSIWTTQNPLTVFISWVNLDFGIEACFCHEMTAFGKTLFQFLFPFYIITLVSLIIIVSKYSVKASKLVTSNIVPCLATLLLLSYTKLLRAIITAFAFTNIHYSGIPPNNDSLSNATTASNRKVWLVDANVDYLQREHIALFVLAVLHLVAGVLFTVLLLIWQYLYPLLTKSAYLSTSRIIASTNHFMEAFHAPFKPRHRYWAGLLLIVRVILYLISVVNVFGNLRSVTLLAIMIAMVGLFLYESLVMNVYKSWAKGFLENTFIANLAVLTSVTFFTTDMSLDKNFTVEQQTKLLRVQAGVVYISIFIALVTFIGIVVYHFRNFVVKKKKPGYAPMNTSNQNEHKDVHLRRGDKKSRKVKFHQMRSSLDLICEQPKEEDYERLMIATDAIANGTKKPNKVTYSTIEGVP